MSAIDKDILIAVCAAASAPDVQPAPAVKPKGYEI